MTYDEDSFDPDLVLETVLETSDPIALGLAKASLEEAGIPFLALNDIARLIDNVDPFVHKTIRVQVAGDRVEEALEVLAPLLEPDPDAP